MEILEIYFVLEITIYQSIGLVDVLPGLLLGAVPPLLDLYRSLAHDTGGAAEGGANIPCSVPLYVVPLPGLLPEEEGGDAGHDAAREAVKQATLPHIISCGIGKAGSAAHPTTTYPHVSTTAAQALLPFCGHGQGVDLK